MTPEERSTLVAELAEILKGATPRLTEDEQTWVKMAIQKEAQSIKLRNAIIEKTLGGLAWAGIVGLGFVLLDFAKSHGIK